MIDSLLLCIHISFISSIHISAGVWVPVMYRKIVSVFFLLIFSAYTKETSILADPDLYRSGMSWTTEGIPLVTIGDLISFGRFGIGGMLEARNEKRFNQELFPNHNWRGLGRFEAVLFGRLFADFHCTMYADLRHESAHPTMGIVEATDKAYEMIYDEVYRRMILNSVSLSGGVSRDGARHLFFLRIYYNYYFLSKNTPELASSVLTQGNGISGGVQWQYRVQKWPLKGYLSLYDRYIFTSSKKAAGNLYSGNGALLAQSDTEYPVLNGLNTVVCKGGIVYTLKKSGRDAGFFARLLYGGPFGFVDSRDTRLVLSFGFEFYH